MPATRSGIVTLAAGDGGKTEGSVAAKESGAAMRIWLVMFVAGMLGASVQVSFAGRKAYIGEGVLLSGGHGHRNEHEMPNRSARS